MPKTDHPKMSQKMVDAMQKVVDELMALPKEELRKKIEETPRHPITEMLEESGALKILADEIKNKNTPPE